MVKKVITNVSIENKISEKEVLFIIDYDLVIFGFIRIPMATGGTIKDELQINSSEEIFEIANIIIN